MQDFTVEVNREEKKQTGEAAFSKVESMVKAPNNLVKPFYCVASAGGKTE